MSYNHHYQQPADRKQMTKQFNEANSLKKATNDTQFFWDMVNKNKYISYHNNPRKPSKHEEKILFGKKVENNTERGEIDDNIPVERSGPQSEVVGVLQSFAELEDRVPPYVTSNIALMKYEKPTPIQKHSIPLGLEGLDLMCCAQTGSGKTFAFLLPVVARLDAAPKPADPSPQPESSPTPTAATPEPPRVSIDKRGSLPRCIILAPTRELASQIHLDARRLIYNSRLKAVCVYGGNDLRSQLVELSTGCDIIVATPGRLNDLVDRGCVSLSEVCFFILDEADRMLDMGFEPQIRRIVSEYDMPRRENRQTFMFSATFPPEIQTLAREFLRAYVWIGVGRVGSTVENIRQNILQATSNPQDKMKLLIGAINETDGRTLIFVQKRLTATWLCQMLNASYGVNADEIHGDRTQAQREHALRNFRDGYTRILVATDVAARGLDVPAVTHVIQYDMPQSAEDFDVYVHRIGRTGRAGHSGVASSFYVPGREVGEGNGKIAHLILKLLQENKQEIPDWFLNLDDLRYSGGGGGGGGRYSNNGYRNKPYNGGYQSNNHHSNGGQQQKFGWRDVRNYPGSTMYAGSAGGSNGAGSNGAAAVGGGGYESQYNGGGGAHHYQQQQQPPHTQSYHNGGSVAAGGPGGAGGGYYQNGRGSGGTYNDRRAGGGYANYSQPQHQQQYQPPHGYEQNGYSEGYVNGGAYIPAQHQQPYDPAMAQGVYEGGAYYDQYTGTYVDPASMGEQFNAMAISHPHQQHHPQQQPTQWVVPSPVATSPVVPPAATAVAGVRGATNGYRSIPPPPPPVQQQHPQAVAGGYHAYSPHPQSGNGVAVDESTAAYHQYGGNGYVVNGHYPAAIPPIPVPAVVPHAAAHANNQGYHRGGGGNYNKYVNANNSNGYVAANGTGEDPQNM